jgi:F-type H+-transporting ATPase subunit delta
MFNLAVARRYATPLFELAQEKGQIDQVESELDLVVASIGGNSRLQAVINDVLISAEVKQNLFRQIFAGKVLPLMLNFLLVVARKRREAHLPEIRDVFVDLANQARGLVEVEVRSAVPLEEATVGRLEKSLVSRLGKRVRFSTQVVPDLIGGLVVRVGDQLMDGSVKTRLHRMKERLVRAKAE